MTDVPVPQTFLKDGIVEGGSDGKSPQIVKEFRILGSPVKQSFRGGYKLHFKDICEPLLTSVNILFLR